MKILAFFFVACEKKCNFTPFYGRLQTKISIVMKKLLKSVQYILGVSMVVSLFACAENDLSLDEAKFDTVVNDKAVKLFTIVNENGMSVSITNFGARIVQILVADKDGKLQDVVLGYDNIKQYADTATYGGSDFGAAIGRYANRINKGHIVVEGRDIQLPVNNYGHCLHGGPQGWQYAVYDGEQVNDSVVKMTLVSPDGDSNFPGEVTASVVYTLKADNTIDVDYTATTTATTVINMTNHSYFNLNGDPSRNIENCELYINADYMTPVDSTFMTTGEIISVKDTPFDFRTPKAIGKDINADNQQLKFGMGYDHNWCLNTYSGSADVENGEIAVSLWSPITGIRLDVYTNEPGVQVYTGNFLDGSVTGKYGKVYDKRAAICLETQKYPDTPNKPNWPAALLKAGEIYHSHCAYKFSVAEKLTK